MKETTSMVYVFDVVNAIMSAFNKTPGIISVPKEEVQDVMFNHLKKTDQHLPHGLFTVDGTHKRCKGRKDKNKRSWKFRWAPAKSFMFIFDRVFGTVCAMSLGHPQGIMIYVYLMIQE